MNDKNAYIPDVSSFFSDGKKYDIKDIMNRLPIEQETVTFEINDIYSGAAVEINFNNDQRYTGNCRKKRGRRKFNTKFKRT